LHAPLALAVSITAVAASLHALARPALLRWANPCQDLELSRETRAFLEGTAVRVIGVATGTVSEGGEESDDLRLRVGSRVLLSPVVADVDPRRLAAVALSAGKAGLGVTSPAVLWVCVAVLIGRDRWSAGALSAATLACVFVGFGVWHAWRHRWPANAVLERIGEQAVLFAYLVGGWTSAARTARQDPEHAADVWKLMVATARDPLERTDGLTAEDVDTEVARLLPRWNVDD